MSDTNALLALDSLHFGKHAVLDTPKA